MQRWVLVRDGRVRCYLLGSAEPNDAAKLLAVFGPDSKETSMAAEGLWLLAPASAGLVGDGWVFSGGVFSAPVLAAPRVLDASEFLGLFTPAEVVALDAADPRLKVGCMKVLGQNQVNLDSLECASLLSLGVAKGAITRARADEVLRGTPPK